MVITDDRIKHSLAVAKKMKEMAAENPDKYPVEPGAAFVLGLLHDVQVSRKSMRIRAARF